MIKKLLAGIVLVLVLVPILAGCGGLPRSAVAEVSDNGNDKVITREDLDNRMAEVKAQSGGQGFPDQGSDQYTQLQKTQVGYLVNEEILWFEAAKMNLSVSDDELNQQIDQYKQAAGGEDQLNQQLSQQNLTMDQFKDRIRKNLLFQKLYPEVTKDAPQVTDEQAQAYYNQNPTQFQVPETRTVRHILVADEATANQVLARLNAGEDFAAVAKEVSIDPGSKDSGGALGNMTKDGVLVDSGQSLIPEFVTAANGLAVSQLSAPVKTQYGYHIIQVTAINPPSTQTFDQVKEDLKQGLYMNNQRDAFDAWFNGVKANYTITYADEFKPDETTATGGTGTGASQAQPAPAGP